jgi:hypothetical protein
VKRQRGKT